MIKQNFIDDDIILRGLFLQLMIVNIMIGLVLPFNQFVDSMLTGKGLGISALKAYALYLPVGSLVIALSIFFPWEHRLHVPICWEVADLMTFKD